MLSSSRCSTFSCISLPQRRRKQHEKIPSSFSLITSRRSRGNSFSVVCMKVDIAEIAQNKVLIAATVASIIGQLSKPFSKSLFSGDKVGKLDFGMLFRSGGFPSTHSSGVVAAATSLGLERGFSDSIFGMTVIFAGIVMYDAQAVRREVGVHAKLLNKTVLFKPQIKPHTNGNNDSIVNSRVAAPTFTESEACVPQLSISESKSTCTVNSSNPLYLTSENRPNAAPSHMANDTDPTLQETYNTTEVTLEESIGHTTTEVLAGALLGFAVTLAVYNVL